VRLCPFDRWSTNDGRVCLVGAIILLRHGGAVAPWEVCLHSSEAEDAIVIQVVQLAARLSGYRLWRKIASSEELAAIRAGSRPLELLVRDRIHRRLARYLHHEYETWHATWQDGVPANPIK